MQPSRAKARGEGQDMTSLINEQVRDDVRDEVADRLYFAVESAKEAIRKAIEAGEMGDEKEAGRYLEAIDWEEIRDDVADTVTGNADGASDEWAEAEGADFERLVEEARDNLVEILERERDEMGSDADRVIDVVEMGPEGWDVLARWWAFQDSADEEGEKAVEDGQAKAAAELEAYARELLLSRIHLATVEARI